MTGSVSHDLKLEESIEARARWFQSLTLIERMDSFCQTTNLGLENNPGVVEKEDARSTSGRVRVLSLSKRAAGREVDLEDARLLDLSLNNKAKE